MNTGEKVLSVGKIRKVNTSYGNYCFDVEILKKGRLGEYKLNLPIFGHTLNSINQIREEYLRELEK